MGNLLCRHRHLRVMFLGLDSVGKTSLLYHLKLGEAISNMPSSVVQAVHRCEEVGPIAVTPTNCVSFTYAIPSINRELWRHFFIGTDAFVFVLDSCDKQYFHEAMHEFDRVCYDDRTRDTVFMVVANKQDLDGAMSAQEIEDQFIEKNFHHHTIFVVPCNALDLKQVRQIFTRFIHFVCLNQAGKLKRGLITLKEQSEMEEASKTSTLKSLLKSPVEFMKSLF